MTDVCKADVSSDYDREGKNGTESPMGKHQEDSGKSLRNEEFEHPECSSSNPVQYTDQERVELLKRIESIKDHILRGSNMGDKPIESDQSSVPSLYRPYPQPFPYLRGKPMMMNGMHPPMSNLARVGFQVHSGAAPNWQPGHYPNPMTRLYVPGQYGSGPDAFETRPQDPIHHHPFFAATSSRHGHVPYAPLPRQHEEFSGHGSYNYNTLSASGPHGHHTRRPSDLDSEMRGALYVQKKAVPDTGAFRCCALAGGAPFIACHKCFELLYLPEKPQFVPGQHQMLQCGACSQVISFTIGNKKLVFTSVHVETNTVPALNSISHDTQSSVDHSYSGNNFQCMDKEPVEESTKHQETLSEHSGDENLISSDGSQRMDKSIQPPPDEASTLLELFEHSDVNRAALIYEMARLRFNANKQKSLSKQSLMKPDSVTKATETEVSYNGYSNTTEASEDPMDRESRPRNPQVSGCGFMEVTENGKSWEVWVNRRLIQEDEVRSAETLAGPIQPGSYWYDYRAGFWGVMGKPCLGITMPFIEEFSQPAMPDGCAGGNTGVFVNGRELHQRDMDVLARRGLPRGRDRSYIIDIAGRVLDGETGEQLDCLGRLAPSVEKGKRGFGMKAPRTKSSLS